MEITLSILFWGYVIAYCIHVIEETAVGEGFVNMMKETFWPEYTGRMFFGFNAMIFIVFTAGIILYEIFGGLWVIWPLSFAFMFVTNGLWHLLQTMVLKKFSPGLITSPIYWILIYFITRYYVLPGDILIIDFIISMVIGTFITLLMFGSAYYFKLKSKSKP